MSKVLLHLNNVCSTLRVYWPDFNTNVPENHKRCSPLPSLSQPYISMTLHGFLEQLGYILDLFGLEGDNKD